MAIMMYCSSPWINAGKIRPLRNCLVCTLAVVAFVFINVLLRSIGIGTAFLMRCV